jgi:hypothetical protein
MRLTHDTLIVSGPIVISLYLFEHGFHLSIIRLTHDTLIVSGPGLSISSHGLAASFSHPAIVMLRPVASTVS